MVFYVFSAQKQIFTKFFLSNKLCATQFSSCFTLWDISTPLAGKLIHRMITEWTLPGLEPGLPDPEAIVLTTAQTRLHNLHEDVQNKKVSLVSSNIYWNFWHDWVKWWGEVKGVGEWFYSCLDRNGEHSKQNYASYRQYSLKHCNAHTTLKHCNAHTTLLDVWRDQIRCLTKWAVRPLICLVGTTVKLKVIPLK